MIKKYSLLSFLVAFSVNVNAIENQITINKSIIHFNNNENISQSFAVRNGFNNKAYVDTDLYEIINAGKENESKILYKAIDEESEKGKKMISRFKDLNVEIKHPIESDLHQNPPRMILDKKGSYLDTKTISVVNINKELEKEKVYRLRVYPVVKGFEKENKVNGIKFLMQYEVLIMVQPNNPILDYSYEFTNDKTLHVENNGNSNFILEEISQCDENKENCYEIAPKRIYADVKHDFQFKYDTEVNATLNFGGELKEVVFKK